MNKNLKVLGVIILLIGLAVAGWFLYTVSQSQNGVKLTQDNTENQKQEQGDIGIKDGERRRIGGSDTEENKGEMEELQIEDIDTSNWKTYRNEELGFEVKYPAGYYIIENNKILHTVFISKNQFLSPRENVYLSYGSIGFAPSEAKENFIKCNLKKYDENRKVTWLFGCDDDNVAAEHHSDYQLFENLMMGKCNASYISMIPQQELQVKNVNDMKQLDLSCETGNAQDAMVLKAIFNSFKFLNK